MSDETRTQLMIALRRRGCTYAHIGRGVGMSANGVMMALRRVTDPGRYYARLEEEIDADDFEEEW